MVYNFMDIRFSVVHQSPGVGHRTRFKISLYATLVLIRGALYIKPVTLNENDAKKGNTIPIDQ